MRQIVSDDEQMLRRLVRGMRKGNVNRKTQRGASVDPEQLNISRPLIALTLLAIPSTVLLWKNRAWVKRMVESLRKEYFPKKGVVSVAYFHYNPLLRESGWQEGIEAPGKISAHTLEFLEQNNGVGYASLKTFERLKREGKLCLFDVESTAMQEGMLLFAVLSDNNEELQYVRNITYSSEEIEAYAELIGLYVGGEDVLKALNVFLH